MRTAAWSRNLQRLKEFLNGNPLVQSDINSADNVHFLRNYAKQYGLPMPESKDVSKMPALRRNLDYDKLTQEHPELLEEYAQYLAAKDEWMKSLPPQAVPYLENIFSGNIGDMLNHKAQWSVLGDKSTSGKLNKAIWWLKQHGIETPKSFDWKHYTSEFLAPYRGSHQQEFIDWNKYFEQHPELKEQYGQFKKEAVGWEHRHRIKTNDPRDMLAEMQSPPSFEEYIDRTKAPISYDDYINYLWNLSPEHKNRVEPYFASVDTEPNYGDDSDTYGIGDEPDHGDARAHVSPGEYGHGWMVHYSPAAEQIAKEGFQKGVTLQDADTLTQTEGGSGTPGFNFAFETSHPSPMWQGGKAVVFPGHYLNVYHGRNDDNYVLFDGTEIPIEQIFPIVHEGKGWSVYDANGRKLIDQKPVKEVIQWVQDNHGMLQDVKKKA